MNYQSFISSVDSLNSSYLSTNLTRVTEYSTSSDDVELATGNRKTVYTYISKDLYKKSADYLGKIAGSYAGRYVGAAVGTAASNPYLAVCGYLVGKKVGGFVGASVASGIAAYFIGNYLNCQGKTRYYVPSNNSDDTDSLGFIHNQVMYKLTQDSCRYRDNSGVADYGLIYDDCLKYLAEYGVEDEDFYDENVKNKMISSTLEIGEIAKTCIAEAATDSVFMEKSAELLINDYGITELSKSEIMDFGIKILTACQEMDYQQMKAYAIELDALIENSALPVEQKAELSGSAEIIVNSSMCW